MEWTEIAPPPGCSCILWGCVRVGVCGGGGIVAASFITAVMILDVASLSTTSATIAPITNHDIDRSNIGTEGGDVAVSWVSLLLPPFIALTRFVLSTKPRSKTMHNSNQGN